MRIGRILISAAFAAGLALMPASAKAQYYYPPPCSPFPLFWPFCVAGAILGTAAVIVTAPFRALAGAPPFPPPFYGPPLPPPPYYPPGYPPPPAYSAPR